jgi:catechol 2,3-dioxygenase-like lactoylglutathione lyase family enzyme
MTEDGGAAVSVTGFDHLVLRVADVERSLAFYTGVLGLSGVRVDEWRAGAVLFPSVRIDAATILDLLAAPDEAAARTDAARNVDHLCLVIEPCDLDALAASGAFEVVGGPAELFGARGLGRGLYVRDPDGNVVELRQYHPV